MEFTEEKHSNMFKRDSISEESFLQGCVEFSKKGLDFSLYIEG